MLEGRKKRVQSKYLFKKKRKVKVIVSGVFEVDTHHISQLRVNELLWAE